MLHVVARSVGRGGKDRNEVGGWRQLEMQKSRWCQILLALPHPRFPVELVLNPCWVSLYLLGLQLSRADPRDHLYWGCIIFPGVTFTRKISPGPRKLGTGVHMSRRYPVLSPREFGRSHPPGVGVGGAQHLHLLGGVLGAVVQGELGKGTRR